ncbi:MAG: RICIN domain-containing protein [Akkermansiaceae bacterium]|nr:RICIN domain-containing protein [Verrucomicrobiales bacterium]
MKRLLLLLSAVLVAQTSVRIHAAPPPGKNYSIVLEDNFNGTTLDTTKWSYNYPWGTTHNHMANMQASQVTISAGYLNLKAEAFRSIWDPWGYWDNGFNKYISFDYTSGAIHSQGKKHFTRGYFEARIKMPWQTSTWPAFWTLQEGWPPEIDFMEVQGARNRYFYNYHYGPDWTQHQSFGGQLNSVDLSAGFHTYGCEWTANEMIFYFNDVQVGRYWQPGPIAQAANMYLILNLAVGGWAPDPVATQYPATMQVDWVRVHQSASTDFSGTYEIKNKKSGKNLDVNGGAITNGAKIQIWTDTSGANQKWIITHVGEGYYKIINQNSGKSLDVWNGGTGDNVIVSQYTYYGNPQQLFRFDSMGGGYYRIVPKHSGKCLVTQNGGTANGTQIIQYTWNGSDDQRWQLQKQ